MKELEIECLRESDFTLASCMGAVNVVEVVAVSSEVTLFCLCRSLLPPNGDFVVNRGSLSNIAFLT